ncbi:hypothetical RHH DNA-binding protein [Alphaspiravirus yamagawaense]|uniref:Hypothetical RHH DNA-binding protein n=1 Tax=Alphaspiravirus yamagawaense TaxID=1157339 RepID=J7QDH6_9VIRU|nr:hypothetical RHH DNA-binding protein [Aeropyrum coil-shaped virus]CCG27866.1 hypothetical RHH DNA-binding protein [Aeropyrum coil-shaped virus]
MKVIQTKLGEEEYKVLKEIAEAQGVSMYELVRRIVLKELAKMGKVKRDKINSQDRLEELEHRVSMLEERVKRIETDIKEIKQRLQRNSIDRWVR